MIKRLQVQTQAAAAGKKISSPGLNLCADSYSVSVAPLCYCSGT